MKKDITAQDFANEILMDKKNPFAYLFVEGESDNDFFAKFIDSTKCYIRVTFGNFELLKVFDILENHNADNQVVGVIDADFRRLTNNIPTHPHIFLTDTHDLETMIVQTKEVLDLVTNKFCRKKDTESNKNVFLSAKKQTIQNFLLQLALPIAFFKYLSDEKKYKFKFKRNPLDKRDDRPDYKKFIDKEKMEIDIDNLINEIKNCSDDGLSSRSIPNAQLKIEIEEIKNKLQIDASTIWQICNGHHITNILSVALLKAFSNYDSEKKEVDSKVIENELIANYDSMYFKQTKLYTQIKEWEDIHIVIFKIF